MTDQIEQEKNLTTIQPKQEIVAVGNQIDVIVNECLPVATQDSQNFVQALTLANGIKELRRIFLTDKNIKETVQAMQNTHLGFMTDRTPLAIWKSEQGSGKKLKPYRYEDVAEVCIEAMLKGYRITNNEFNMLVGRFYAAKNGKFRRIQEYPGVTDFQFTTTSPSYEPVQSGVQYAKVQGFASWRKDGQLATLGSSAVSEDKLVFKIRVNKMMGEDAIVGKALSKLFSRVLMRLEGKIMPESTDVSDDDVVDAEFDASDLSEKIKKSQKVEEKEPTKIYEPKPNEPEKPKTIKEPFFEGQEPELQKTEESVTESDSNLTEGMKKNKAMYDELDFHEEWRNKRTAGFSTYVYKNRTRFENASPELQAEAQEKWEKLYPTTLWPIEPKPKDDKKSKMIDAIQGFFESEAIERALSYQHQDNLNDCTFETLEMIYGYLQKSESEDLE